MAMMKATLTLGDHTDLFSLIHPQTMLPEGRTHRGCLNTTQMSPQ